MSLNSLKQSSQRQRCQRRFRHHCVLALVSIVAITVIFLALPSDKFPFRLSMATAYTGLILLGTTLLCGPLNIFMSRPNPISTDWRRDIGIWSGIVGLLHVVFGLQVHLKGKVWLYFLYPANESHWLPIRLDTFGFANYTGLLATLILLLLLALSNDLSLRLLGAKSWKALQRWNYELFVLVALHAIAYQLIEKRQMPYPLLFTAILVVVVALQSAGFWQKKQRS